MDSLPICQERVPTLYDLKHQAPHLIPLDADARDKLRPTAFSREVDLCAPGSGYVNMCRVMIGRVDHEPEAVRAMYDDHHLV
jgi:hypothetical protein